MQVLQHECEMQRMYKAGYKRCYENAIGNTPLRKQVELLVRHDILHRSGSNGSATKKKGTTAATAAGAASARATGSSSSSARRGSAQTQLQRHQHQRKGSTSFAGRADSIAGTAKSAAAMLPGRRDSLSEQVTGRRSSLGAGGNAGSASGRRLSTFRMAEMQEQQINAGVLMSTVKRSQDLKFETNSVNGVRRMSTVVGAEAAGCMAFAAAREQLQTVRVCPTDDTRNDFRRNLTLVHLERYFLEGDRGADVKEDAGVGLIHHQSAPGHHAAPPPPDGPGADERGDESYRRRRRRQAQQLHQEHQPRRGPSSADGDGSPEDWRTTAPACSPSTSPLQHRHHVSPPPPTSSSASSTLSPSSSSPDVADEEGGLLVPSGVDSLRRGRLWTLAMDSSSGRLGQSSCHRPDVDEMVEGSCGSLMTMVDGVSELAPMSIASRVVMMDAGGKKRGGPGVGDREAVLRNILESVDDVVAQSTPEKFRTIEKMILVQKLNIFLDQLWSIYLHYAERSNVYYREDIGVTKDHPEDGGHGGDDDSFAGIDSNNGSNNVKTDDGESSTASGLFDVKKETMVLFQFWQFVKESHLVSRELTLAKINRLLNDLLDDGHDGAGDGDDDHGGVDDGSVHSPLRGPISFVKFISATIRILIVRMRQHESGTVDAAAATAHGATNGGASEPTAHAGHEVLPPARQPPPARPRLSQVFVSCMETFITRSSCGQHRPPFYNRFYDALTQRLLQREDGFIRHLYCLGRGDYQQQSQQQQTELTEQTEQPRSSLPDGGNAASSSRSGARPASSVSSTGADRTDSACSERERGDACGGVGGGADESRQQQSARVNMTVADVGKFLEQFDMYRGMLTPDNYVDMVSEVMGLVVYDEEDKLSKKVLRADDSDEVIFEEFVELICRVAIAHLPRFKALVSPLTYMLEKVFEILKRLSSVHYLYHMDMFAHTSVGKKHRDAKKVDELIKNRIEAEKSRKLRIEQRLTRVRASILSANSGQGTRSGIDRLADAAKASAAAAAAAGGGTDAGGPRAWAATTDAAMTAGGVPKDGSNAVGALPKRQRRTNIFKKAATDLSM